MAQMTSNSTLENQINELNSLLSSLNQCQRIQEKIEILNQLQIVKDFFNQKPPLNTHLTHFTDLSEYVIKSIIAIGQGNVVFRGSPLSSFNMEECISQLLEIEKFYECIGGIIGYHVTALSLIFKQTHCSTNFFNIRRYICPEGLCLDQNDKTEINEAVRWGIENSNNIFEMYPVGGAGDRLDLKCHQTKESLPVAVLPFLGKTLFEGLIRDVQGREYLYFKLTNQQICIPLVLMTSDEKNNHTHILNIIQENHWFGRPEKLFFFIKQPLVPVITEKGDWSLSAPLKLFLKPSGHGAIWKLAEEQGVFDKLSSLGKDQCLIRQINNPLAGVNHSLLALMGIGCHRHQSFGFLSCERLKNSSEGIDVIIETEENDEFNYCLTNIEYTDFGLLGINDSEESKDAANFSSFPTNTNILFAHIPSIQNVLKNHPIPGQLINMKSKVSFISPDGAQSWVNGGRVESTMQNIADYLVDRFPQPLDKEQLKKNLKTFLIYNDRSHTISSTKKAFKPNEPSDSTPEQSFYDFLHNNYLLLKECGFKLPKWKKFDELLKTGPASIFLFHPALGPLYSIIQQKLRNGHFHLGSELQLEIAEIHIQNFKLQGSCLISAKNPLGRLNAQHQLEFGFEPRCFFKDVSVINRGIDYSMHQDYWKNSPLRLEKTEIILNEGSEFFAEGIILEGNHLFEVPKNQKLTLRGKGKKWKEEYSLIEKPSWTWEYSFNAQNEVVLSHKIS